MVVSRQVLLDSKFSSVVCAPVYSRYDGLAPSDGGHRTLTHFVGRLGKVKLDELDQALAAALDLDLIFARPPGFNL